MTLEDFFTLTEIKDGLTASSRVEELVNIMQKDRDCAVKNIGDATRQWAAVATTIAATKKKDCLDLFAQLDGLWFIDRWLKDALKFSNDSADNIEESIIALLRALENLHVDNERLSSSGIINTIKNLLGHSSSQVQEIARQIFDSWEPERISDAKEETHAAEVPKVENLLTNTENLKLENDENVQIQTRSDELQSDMAIDCSDTTNRARHGLSSSLVSSAVKESVSSKEIETKFTETAPGEVVSSPFSKEGNAEELLAATELDELSKDEKQVVKRSSSVDKLASAVPISSTVEPASNGDVASARTEGPISQKNDNTIEVRTSACEPNSGTADTGITSNSSKSVCSLTGQDEEHHSDTLQDSSGNAPMYGKLEFLETAYSNMRGIAVDDKENTYSDRSEDLRNVSHFSRPANSTRGLDGIGNRATDMELEYGIVDALEVARKVAQEVEREVEDYREPSCSSSEKVLGRIRQTRSSDSINGKQDVLTELAKRDVPAGTNHCAQYPEGKGLVSNSSYLDTEAKNGVHDMESSLVTDVAQEPENNSEKGMCDFDLNQEVSSEDMDQNTVNSISTPIPVVSASRAAAAAPGLPVSPLQFEGVLGWKGSAATSAFRPASPRKIANGDKTILFAETENSSKKRQGGFLNFDLNVAEDGDDKSLDLVSEKQNFVFSSLQSAESSLEVSSKSERLKLDLNLVGDCGDTLPSDLRTEGRGLHYQNGHHSSSPASSSSMRNIDLNDRPNVHVDSFDQGSYYRTTSQTLNACGQPKSGEPVISIFGTRVEVNRNNHVPQVLSLANGKALEHAGDANMARAGVPLGLVPSASYTPSPVYGYNGLATAPGVPFASAMYGPGGPVPYMVDSRGAPFMPQIIGSASGVPPPYSQPSFIMSMNGTPLGLNGSGSSRPSFDLNSGFAMEGGNRENMNLRQLFMPGSQVRSMEEHMRSNSQLPSSSINIGGKRKEPDGGWESYPFNYRHQQQQPPWK